MQLVLNTHGLSLKVKDGLFRVSGKKAVRDISPEQISSIAITSPCLLSSAAVRLAAESDIAIYFFDRFGDADACLRSPYFETIATLRRKQVYFSDRKEGSAWVVRQFELKTAGQITNLKLLHDRVYRARAILTATIQALSDSSQNLSEKFVQIPDTEWSSRLMGWEGIHAKQYWAAISQGVPDIWTFAGRSRRPAADAYNALTNYFYGMLYALVERALFGAGLDPHLGILHADEYDRPTLAYDLIEPFRPWVDRFILSAILKEKLKPDGLVEQKGEGVWLSKSSKKQLIPAFNEWMNQTVRWTGRQMRREAHIFRHAAELAKLIRLTIERPGS
ncbi:MAG: CRISPR-associated endonuclease Cas1 [Bacteroidota bacterium]